MERKKQLQVILMVFSLAFSLMSLQAAQRVRLDYCASARESGRIPSALTGASASVVDSGVVRQARVSLADAPMLDRSLQVGDELTLALFADVELTLTLVEKTPSTLGNASFLATVSGYDGVRGAVVVQTDDGLQVDVRDSRRAKAYSVFSTKEGVSVREVVPTSKPCTCATPPEPSEPSAGAMAESAPPSAATSAVSSQTQARTGETYVDVLIVYDKLASSWVQSNGGGVSNFAEIAVQKMNTVLANTGLDSSFRFRLVGVREVQGAGTMGDSEGRTINTILTSIVSDGVLNGYNWGKVRDLREECDADIVCVLTDTGYDWGVVGSGYYLTPDIASSFSERAYNCCAVRAVAQSYSMAHEVGHNMGAGHPDTMADKSACGPQYHSYSSGCFFHVGTEGHYTVMGYNNDGYGNFYTEVPFYSSPDHTYRGVCVGDATHDNTRTIRKNFQAVSRFRGPSEASAVGAAVDAEGYTWESSANCPWTVMTDAATRGSSSARSCEMSGVMTSWLRTTVSGPTTLSFDYQLRTYGGRFAVECDSTVLFELDGQEIPYMSWSSQSVSVPEGQHVIRFSYTHPGQRYLNGWGNGVRLDRVTFSGGSRSVATYAVSFDANGGAPTPTAFARTEGSACATLPSVERAGYAFDGWYTARSGGEKVTTETTVTADMTLYAHWTAVVTESVSVVFDACGGVVDEPCREVAVESEIGSLPEPARVGYAFAGWYAEPIGGESVSATTVVAAGRTFYAHWSPVGYEVSFDANGGSGTMARQRLAYDDAALLSSNAFSRSGCVFAGWALSATSGVVFSDGASVSNLTAQAGSTIPLYAVWRAQLTVKASSSKAGTVSGGGTYNAGTKVALRAEAKSGYVFTGWFSDKACSAPLNPAGEDNRAASVLYTMPAQPVTVYAKFSSVSLDKKKLSFSSSTKKLAKTAKSYTAGSPVSLKLGITSLSQPKVSATGLPAGLSIDSRTGAITGTATKPGSYTVKVTVKSAAGNVIRQNVKITVKAPSWSYGTFYGYGYVTVDGKKTAVKVSFTATSLGKVSGKVTCQGRSASFTASYSSATGDEASFTIKFKTEGTVYKSVVSIRQEKDGLSYTRAQVACDSFELEMQKKVSLVSKGKTLAGLLNVYYMFKKGYADAKLSKTGDKLKTLFSDKDTLVCSGTVKGVKFTGCSVPLMARGKQTADGLTTYTLLAPIVEPKTKYARLIVFGVTVKGKTVKSVTATFAPLW